MGEDEPEDGDEQFSDSTLREALSQASERLSDDDLESFVLVSYDGEKPEVTLHADQIHDETEMPMPQMLLATLIYDYSQRTDRRPLRIGQAATYAAEQIFSGNFTDAEWIRNLGDELNDLDPRNK